jgi:uncharacterized membrane protein YfcA
MEITLTTYLIILPMIFLAGLIDSIAGGGGLISVPAYLAAGLPPHFALGNNKFSSCSGTIFTTARYFQHGMIDIPVALTSAGFALIGSTIGTKTVLWLDPSFVYYILLFLIPAMTIFTIFKKQMGKKNNSAGIPKHTKLVVGASAGLIIGFYDGFFGPGTGSFLIMVYTLILKYDFVMANGNTKVVNLASNIAAVITFLLNGKVLFAIAIPAALCGIAGNLTGSHIVVKKGNKIIKPIFIGALIILMGKIIYDLIVS